MVVVGRHVCWILSMYLAFAPARAEASQSAFNRGHAAFQLGAFERALRMARDAGVPSVAAAALNDLGNLRAMEGKYPETLAAYRESVSVARTTGQRLLSARASTNAAAALRQFGQPQTAPVLLDTALDDMRQMKASHDMAFALVGIAYRDLGGALPGEADSLRLRGGRALSGYVRSVIPGMGSCRRSSFPVAVIGSSARNSMTRGTL